MDTPSDSENSANQVGGDSATVSLSERMLEALIEEKVRERVNEIEQKPKGSKDRSSRSSWTRRGILGTLGLGAAGASLASARPEEPVNSGIGRSSQPRIEDDGTLRDFEVADLNVESITADFADIRELNGIRYANNADELQKHIDDLDGSKDGQSGGVVALKPKRYSPSSPITLRRSVHLIGCQHNYLRSGFGSQGNNKISVIDDSNLSSGQTLIRTPTQPDTGRVEPADTASVQYLWLDGGKTSNTKGVHLDNVNSGMVNRCHITGFQNHGVHLIGCFDSTVRATDIEAGTVTNSGAGIRLESDGELSRDCQVGVSGSVGSNYRAIWNSSSVLRVFSEGFRTKLRAANGSPTSDNKGAGLYHDTKGVSWLVGAQIEAKDEANYAGIWTNQQVRFRSGNITEYDWGIYMAGGGRTSVLEDVWIEKQRTNNIYTERAGNLPKLNGVGCQDAGGDALMITGDSRKSHPDLLIDSPNGAAINHTRSGETIRIDNFTSYNTSKLLTGDGTVIANGVELLPGIGNSDTKVLNAESPVNGIVQVRDTTNGQYALFHLYNGGIEEMSDPNGRFGVGSESGNDHDVVWTGSQHRIENRSGGSVDYEVQYGGDRF